MSAIQTRLQPGDSAPAFALPDAHGVTHRLADYAGRRLLLFVYPAAGTPGCTKEACDFRDSVASFQSVGYAILGLSPDDPSTLARFDEDNALGYPLLSDPAHATISAYGAYGPKKLYGRAFDGVIRSTFAIDPDGRIAHALYNVRATGHVGRLRTLLSA